MTPRNSYTFPLSDEQQQALISLLNSGNFAPADVPHTCLAVKGENLICELRNVNPQVLVVRSTRVMPEALDAAPSLELIVRAGAG